MVVLDYGSGNLRSAERALAAAGADVRVTDDLAAAAAPMVWWCRVWARTRRAWRGSRRWAPAR